MKAILALESGRIFPCRSFTGPGEATGEVVFNTSMTGYQEILTDPSYRGQMVTMTYPLIGNYGVNPEDVESDRIQVSAFIVKEYQDFPSNFRSRGTLADYLKKEGIIGIEDLDTRALTRHIRNAGSMRAVISTEDVAPEILVGKAKNIPDMAGQDLVKLVTTDTPYRWVDNKPSLCNMETTMLSSDIWKHKADKLSVVALDYGIKYNIIRCLEKVGCEVIVVPATTSAADIKSMKPDGIFLSNGPGDPEPVTYAIDTLKKLVGFRPMFGICLGHQLLSIALGGKTYKLKFGHRGGNQPAKNLMSSKVEITSQNHGFAVDLDSMTGKSLELVHVNLNDNTVEGFRHKDYPIFAVQYHPEASPGPHDASYLFDEFVNLMKEHKK
ncbi:MAG: glutamine-hydrolyzing carbamoyl-phosphate synthase small subunit [Proteobacteria bacterium]|nr:glutamine-hydrolyzing carbamoyl-phosphate synthase small subunit [Pseudomonadota bacterium]